MSEHIYDELLAVSAITVDQWSDLYRRIRDEQAHRSRRLQTSNVKAGERFDALPRWRAILALLRYGSRNGYVCRTRDFSPL